MKNKETEEAFYFDIILEPKFFALWFFQKLAMFDKSCFLLEFKSDL